MVLKPWAAGYPFYYGALKAWEHYVPLKDDLSDLLERVRWLRRRWLHTRPSPDGAWTAPAPLRFLGVKLDTRMTALRLGDGGVLLISPCYSCSLS